MRIKRLVLGICLAAMLALGPTAAFAGGTGKSAHCNSGNGNGQETTIDNDCDPGNSAGHNSGGG